MATVTFAEGGRPDCQRLPDMWPVGASTMCIAIEFLNGPAVLMLRVYAQWKGTERRTAVKNVPGAWLLSFGHANPDRQYQVAPDLLPDVGALTAALATSFPESRIAVVVSDTSPQPEPTALGTAVFTSREDALAWLTESAR